MDTTVTMAMAIAIRASGPIGAISVTSGPTEEGENPMLIFEQSSRDNSGLRKSFKIQNCQRPFESWSCRFSSGLIKTELDVFEAKQI